MKPSRRRRAARIASTVLAVLVEKYPATFTMLESKWVPLKVGIGGDVIANHPELKPSQIGQALYWYTHSTDYMAKLIEGADRIDLTGQPAGVVSATEAADALERLNAAQARARKASRVVGGTG
jgi:ProP effector